MKRCGLLLTYFQHIRVGYVLQPELMTIDDQPVCLSWFHLNVVDFKFHQVVLSFILLL